MNSADVLEVFFASSASRVILEGSDKTSVAMRPFFYWCLVNDKCVVTNRYEMDMGFPSRRLSVWVPDDPFGKAASLKKVREVQGTLADILFGMDSLPRPALLHPTSSILVVRDRRFGRRLVLVDLLTQSPNLTKPSCPGVVVHEARFGQWPMRMSSVVASQDVIVTVDTSRVGAPVLRGYWKAKGKLKFSGGGCLVEFDYAADGCVPLSLQLHGVLGSSDAHVDVHVSFVKGESEVHEHWGFLRSPSTGTNDTSYGRPAARPVLRHVLTVTRAPGEGTNNVLFGARRMAKVLPGGSMLLAGCGLNMELDSGPQGLTTMTCPALGEAGRQVHVLGGGPVAGVGIVVLTATPGADGIACSVQLLQFSSQHRWSWMCGVARGAKFREHKEHGNFRTKKHRKAVY
jgi:hypothetical protein